MSLYTDASLIMYPSGYKEDKIYSLKPTDGSGDLTFTRASTATRVNAEGLIEESPVNLLQQSNSFDTTWLSSGTTETSGQSGYDGTNHAWLLQRSDGAARFVYQTVSITNTYTFSVYAKAGNVNWMYFNNGAGASAYFDLENGAVGTITGGNTASIESVGNGWYRCSAVLTNGSDNRIYPAVSNGTINGLVGANIYIQNAQLNIGATAKPYFPTTDRLNVPRIDYTSGCGSLLLEKQSTNLALYSEQIDNAAYFKINDGASSTPIVTANYSISPDGTQNADRVQFARTGTSVGNYSIIGNSAAINLSSIGTFSVYLKSLTTTTQNVLIYWDGGAGVGNVYQVTTEWQRFELNNLPVSTASFVIGTRGGSGSFINGGDLSLDIAVYGAQLESSSYPTSYIPTTSTAVTRLADAALTASVPSLIGQTEGVLFVEMKRESLSESFFVILSYIAGTTAGSYGNSIYFYQLPNDIFVSDGYVSNDSQFGFSSAGLSIGTHKIAIAYKQNDFALYIDGVLIGTDTSGTVPAMNFLTIAGGADVLGHKNVLNQVQLYKTRLSNAELATLTTL